MSIPDALRATVLRRLRRLSRAERELVMQAAAIGAYVDVVVLAAIADAAEDYVRAVLERAEDLQLVVSLRHGRFAFRHALTRDIIYAEMRNGSTRALHRRIVYALERLRTNGHVPLADLAYHAWAAGDALRALRYNEQAGDHAAAVHANDDARKYYARACSFMEIDSAEYFRLNEKLRTLA